MCVGIVVTAFHVMVTSSAAGASSSSSVKSRRHGGATSVHACPAATVSVPSPGRATASSASRRGGVGSRRSICGPWSGPSAAVTAGAPPSPAQVTVASTASSTPLVSRSCTATCTVLVAAGAATVSTAFVAETPGTRPGVGRSEARRRRQPPGDGDGEGRSRGREVKRHAWTPSVRARAAVLEAR